MRDTQMLTCPWNRAKRVSWECTSGWLVSCRTPGSFPSLRNMNSPVLTSCHRFNSHYNEGCHGGGKGLSCEMLRWLKPEVVSKQGRSIITGNETGGRWYISGSLDHWQRPSHRWAPTLAEWACRPFLLQCCFPLGLG